MDGNLTSLSDLWPGYHQLLPWIVILWIAIGPESSASLLRNKGQQSIPPSQAQARKPCHSLNTKSCIAASVCFCPLLVGTDRRTHLAHGPNADRDVDRRWFHYSWRTCFVYTAKTSRVNPHEPSAPLPVRTAIARSSPGFQPKFRSPRNCTDYLNGDAFVQEATAPFRSLRGLCRESAIPIHRASAAAVRNTRF